jgi:hypothetical protein
MYHAGQARWNDASDPPLEWAHSSAGVPQEIQRPRSGVIRLLRITMVPIYLEGSVG